MAICSEVENTTSERELVPGAERAEMCRFESCFRFGPTLAWIEVSLKLQPHEGRLETPQNTNVRIESHEMQCKHGMSILFVRLHLNREWLVAASCNINTVCLASS